MAVLTVKGISLSFGEERILEDVSFELQKGERVGLAGACPAASLPECFSVLLTVGPSC